MCRCGHEIGWLEHHAVAVGQRRRNLPSRDCDREVPGRDHAHNADGLARDLDIDARPGRGELVACHAQTLAREEQEDLSRAHRLADAFGQGLAFLTRKNAADLVLARQELVAHTLEDVVARLDARPRPGRKGILGGCYGNLSLGGVGVDEAPDHVIGVGRVDVFADVGALDPIAANVVPANLGHGTRSFSSDILQIDAPARSWRMLVNPRGMDTPGLSGDMLVACQPTTLTASLNW